MNVSVRELKAGLSRYLREARAGRDVVITSRGRPVARLLPVSGSPAEKASEAELMRRLRLIPGVELGAGGKPQGSKRPIKIRPGRKTLAETVIQDRR